MTLSFPTTEAWQPLPDRAWNAAAAGHLLRRASWTARSDEIDRAVHDGLAASSQ